MTDKELRTLTKVQMLDILYKQEKEIEDLKDGLGQPRIGPGVSLDDIVQATREAADSYMKSVMESDSYYLGRGSALEADAKRRWEESERMRMEADKVLEEKVTELDNIFTWLQELIVSLHEEFREKIGATGLGGFLPHEDQKDQDSHG